MCVCVCGGSGGGGGGGGGHVLPLSPGSHGYDNYIINDQFRNKYPLDVVVCFVLWLFLNNNNRNNNNKTHTEKKKKK